MSKTGARRRASSPAERREESMVAELLRRLRALAPRTYLRLLANVATLSQIPRTHIGQSLSSGEWFGYMRPALARAFERELARRPARLETRGSRAA